MKKSIIFGVVYLYLIILGISIFCLSFGFWYLLSKPISLSFFGSMVTGLYTICTLLSFCGGVTILVLLIACFQSLKEEVYYIFWGRK